jgi:hypothetical protein
VYTGDRNTCHLVGDSTAGGGTASSVLWESVCDTEGGGETSTPDASG